MKKLKYKILFSLLSFLLSFNICSAALIDGLRCATDTTGPNCDLNDFVRIGINAVQLIFGLAGSLALIFFIYGGIIWVISGGNPDRVKKGLDAIKNAVIGLVIIFASYMIINFTVTSLGYDASKFNPWNTTPSGSSSSSSSQDNTAGCCFVFFINGTGQPRCEENVLRSSCTPTEADKGNGIMFNFIPDSPCPNPCR